MNGSEGSKRTAVRQRLLLSGILAGALAIAGITTANADNGAGSIRALSAGRPVAITLPTVPTTPSVPAISPATIPAQTAGSTIPTAPTTTTVPAPAAQPSAAPAADPAPEPAPEPTPVSYSPGSVEDAIATYFGDVYNQAYNVANCESHLNPDAVSAGGYNWGLFQINIVHKERVESMGYSWDQILDPYVNAAVARSIYDDAGGWSPWGCRRAAYY